MADGQDILLGFAADAREALEDVLSFVRQSSAALISLGETHPEVVLDISHAAESLRDLERQIRAVIAGEVDASGRPLTIDTAQAQDRLDSVLGLMRGLNEEFLRLPDASGAAAGAVASDAERMAEAERIAAEEAARLRAALASVAREAEEVGGAGAAALEGPLAAAAAEARTQISRLVTELIGASRATPELAEQIARAEAAVRGFGAAIDAAREAGSPVPPSAESQLLAFQSNLRQAAEGARALAGAAPPAAAGTREIGKSVAGTSSAFDRFGHLISRVAFGLEYFTAQNVARHLLEWAGAAEQAAEKGQKLSIALGSAAGSAKAGAEAEAFLRAEAHRLGFDVNAVASEYARLTTVSRSSNLALDDQRSIFSRTAEVVASLRLGTQETNTVLKTFSGIIDRGSINAQELRRRISELPGGLGALRAAASLTETELTKMAKGGTLAASVLLPMITRLAEEVGGGYRDALASAGAEQDRLTSTLEEDAAAIGQQFLPALAEATADFRNWIETNREAIQSAGLLTSALVDMVDFFGTHYGRMIAWEEKLGAQINRTLEAVASRIHDSGQLAAADEELAAAEGHLAEASLTAADRAAQHEVELHREATAMRSMIPDLEAAIAATLSLGKVKASEAREEVHAIDSILLKAREYSEADRAAMQSQLDSLQERRTALARYTVDFTKQLDEQIQATRRYAGDFETELRETGTVSHDAADRIIKEVNAEIKAIQQLPVAERAAFGERLAALQALLAEFNRFTTAYEKLGERQEKSAEHVAETEAKQLHEREKNLESSIRRMTELASRKIDAGGGADLKGAQSDLAKQQQELQALRDKPSLSAEDENRMSELQVSVGHAADAVKHLQQVQTDQATSGAAGAKALVGVYDELHAHIQSLLTEDDKFAADFSRLGPEGQEAFRQITQGLLDSAKAGTASEESIRRWGTDVAGIFQNAGVVATDFTKRLEASLNPARTVGQMLDSIAQSGQRGTAAFGDMTLAEKRLAEGQEKLATTGSQVAAGSHAAAAGLDQQARAVTGVTTGEQQLARESGAVDAALKRELTTATALSGRVEDLSSKLLQGGIVAAREGERLRELGESSRSAEVPLADLAHHMQLFGEIGAKTAGDLPPLAEGVHVLGSRSAETTAELAKLGLASADLAGKSPAEVAAWEAQQRALRQVATAADQATAGEIKVSRAGEEGITKAHAEGEAWDLTSGALRRNADARVTVTDSMVKAVAASNTLTETTKTSVAMDEKDHLVVSNLTEKRRDDTTATKEQTDKSGQLNAALRTEGDSAKSVGDQMAGLVTAHDKSAAAAAKAGAAEQQSAAGAISAGAAAGAAAPLVQKLANALTEIASDDVSSELTGIATGEGAVAAAAAPLVGVLAAVNAQLTRMLALLPQVESAADACAGAVRNLTAAEQTALPACQALTACLGSQAAA